MEVTGYLVLAAFGIAAFGALLVLKLPRALWSFAGAALFLGAAGYAWQGRPALAAHPVVADALPIAIEPGEVALREQLMGRFTADTAYIIASDAMLRDGDVGAATNVILGGIRKLPKSFILWTQLGSVMTIHDGNQVSPAAGLAFARAMRLAPEHPAPPYYAGLAYVRAGDLPKARAWWARAVRLSAPGTGYREAIATQLAMLDGYVAMQQGVR